MKLYKVYCKTSGDSKYLYVIAMDFNEAATKAIAALDEEPQSIFGEDNSLKVGTRDWVAREVEFLTDTVIK
jgi:hypothetical protein